MVLFRQYVTVRQHGGSDACSRGVGIGVSSANMSLLCRLICSILRMLSLQSRANVHLQSTALLVHCTTLPLLGWSSWAENSLLSATCVDDPMLSHHVPAHVALRREFLAIWDVFHPGWPCRVCMVNFCSPGQQCALLIWLWILNCCGCGCGCCWCVCRQALRAAHASGRFSWQDAADRPRVRGVAAAAAAGTSNAQQEHQQQQHLLSLLDQMQLETTGSAADACDVRAAANDQHAMPATAVKPGFYEQQMQRALADAVAASASQEAVQGSSSSNAGASHGHGCGGAATHGCQHSHSHEHDPLEPSPLEPTEAEFNAAVREALQELDVCVVGINDLLDEVREAVQELQEEAS